MKLRVMRHPANPVIVTQSQPSSQLIPASGISSYLTNLGEDLSHDLPLETDSYDLIED